MALTVTAAVLLKAITFFCRVEINQKLRPIFAMMIRLIFIGFIFFSSGFTTLGQSQNLQSFIPADFTILDSASGDINKDGYRDMVIILKNSYEEVNVDTTRPLLVLFAHGQDQYNLGARNDSVVLCKGCGGVFGDPYAGITVKDSFFSIEHYGGSNWRWSRIITFRYDAKSGHLMLHRDAGETFHTAKPNKTKQHIYNKEDFGKLMFSKYSYNKGW